MLKYVLYALKALFYYPFAILCLLLSSFLCVFLYFPLILGAIMVAYQVFLWVHTGNWHPYPLCLVFEAPGIDLTFAYSPQNWKAMAKIARTICDLPLASFLLAAGTVLALLGSAVVVSTFDRIKELRRRLF
jgi:hypothetical protein